MQEPEKQPKDKRRPSEGRGLYGVVVDVSELALALARTYENRPPPLAKRGRPHAV